MYRYLIGITFSLFLTFSACQAPSTQEEIPLNLTGYPEPADLYQKELFPFFHGVASGDPRSDRVVIWTRVTPPTAEARVNVIWEIASDSAFTNILRREDIQAMPVNDYIVKVDVKNLLPDTEYYYRFWSNDVYSPIGRTHTLATEGIDDLRLVVVAGADYRNGNFEVYKQIATLEGIDAVIHLGDYIQAGSNNGESKRTHYPTTSAVTLEDYRLRYSNYHSDPDLQAMHQAHPVIPIWNDGEFANGAYFEGAIDHNVHTQNVWQFRKSMARRAYFDWMPIRMNADMQAYRSFQFGNLAQLVLLDTRMEGRTAAMNTKSANGFEATERTILGEQQFKWLQKKLSQQNLWQIIGSTALLAPFELDEINTPILMEQWAGYPAAQQQLLDLLDNKFKSLILSSDLGLSGAFSYQKNSYELSVPSINQQVLPTSLIQHLNNQYNTEVSNKNGFLILELTKDDAKAIWNFVDGSQLKFSSKE